MRNQNWWGVLVTVLLLVSVAIAGPADPVEPVSGKGIHVPRLHAAPKLDDFLSMHPSARMAGQMVRVSGFTQRDPNDGQPATQTTDVYLGYDQSKFYAVFVCFDQEPALVRAHMSRREDVFADDIVELMLDTFHDERRGYAFIVNPMGIQWDASWSESSGFDSSWDAVWDSRGKRTDKGYVVMMTIPFRSLRFGPQDVQTWGILLNRYIPRLNEDTFWPRLSRDIPGRLNQAAEMNGLERISPGRNMQIIPYFMGRAAQALDTPSNGPAILASQNKVTAGVDAKMVIKDSLVLDATVNPDFSQVESDSPQVTVNQRYEVFFPEKRPFFLENANYFETPFDLVFTRRIAAPDYGLRLSGKLNDYAIGALFADDRNAGNALDPADPGYEKKAYATVLRISRDIGEQSSLGVIYTQRAIGDGINRVGGMDGKVRFAELWSTSFQAVTSSTRNTDGTTDAGPAYQINLSRSGKALGLGASYYDVGTNFHTDLGFIHRPDVRSADSWISYRFRTEDSGLISWGPSFSYDQNWDHTGLLLDRSYSGNVSWSLKKQTSFGVNYRSTEEQLRPKDFDTLTDPQRYDEYSTGFWSSFGMSDAVSFGGGYNWQARINYVPAVGAPEPADGNSGNFWITLRPSASVRIDNTYILDRMLEPETGLNVFNNHIVRSKVNWQFNRELSVRVIAQYNTVLANPIVSSLQNTKNFNTDFLVSYLLHPGTALYMGYNSNLQNLDSSLMTDPSGNLLRTRNGFLNDSRQFFIKLSYLFRM